ncbi:MAG TPA: hypothetical protein VKI19_07275 [Acidimicrobiales bacterium]|nr:hypothetical protein [Acidimicrobiales bacterium]
MASAPPAPPSGDWPADVTARIESVVGSVRDKTTVPAATAARAVVYGLVLGVFAAALGLLLVIALVRLLDVYLPFHPVGRRVWVVDAAASAIFLAGGAFLWRRRRPKGA